MDAPRLAQNRQVAFQMDAPLSLNPRSDTTIALIEEAAARGYQIWWYPVSSLYWRCGEVRAQLQQLSYTPSAAQWCDLGQTIDMPLAQMDIVWMRQDPPFDMSYITATHLLEHAKTRVYNSPAGVRGAPEKLSSLFFSDCMPKTLISADSQTIHAFVESCGTVVAKPLYGYGGRSVFKFTAADGNLDTFLELHQSSSREPLMWQQFLPEVRDQDRRILLINGEVKAVFGRTPMDGSIRANMRVGGTPVACELTAVQQTICNTIAPMLKAQGLLLVGLDVIGDYLTEINVTSPTGFRAAQSLYGVNLAAHTWDAIL